MKAPLFLLAFLTLLTSCGYHLGRGEAIRCYSSVCIPYVEGDDQGLLTTAIIREMNESGALSYATYGADLALKVCLFEPKDENIGFAFAPGENFIVSNEGRVTLTARVTLTDRCTGACVLGPVEISTFIDFDFEPDLGNVDQHAFSLGQLEMHNLALDAALDPAYHLLAQKIVDYVSYGW